MAEIPTPRANLMTAGLGGLVYAVGGFPDTEEPPFTSDVVETFDPRSGRWATSAPLPEPSGAAGIATLNGLLYVAGGAYDVPEGSEDSGLSNEMFVYDPDDRHLAIRRAHVHTAGRGCAWWRRDAICTPSAGKISTAR